MHSPYDSCNSWNKASPRTKPGRPSKKSGGNEAWKGNTHRRRESKPGPRTSWNRSKKKKKGSSGMHSYDCVLHKTCRSEVERRTQEPLHDWNRPRTAPQEPPLRKPSSTHACLASRAVSVFTSLDRTKRRSDAMERTTIEPAPPRNRRAKCQVRTSWHGAETHNFTEENRGPYPLGSERRGNAYVTSFSGERSPMDGRPKRGTLTSSPASGRNWKHGRPTAPKPVTVDRDPLGVSKVAGFALCTMLV